METFLFDAGTLIPACAPTGTVRVADSWRQVDGHVRRLDLHRERFASSVARYAPGLDADALVDAAARKVPDVGEWFPRVRLIDDCLYCDLRPGPPRRPTVKVAVLSPGDPRSNPRVKGPDLGLGGELIAHARTRGVDEVLLRSAEGLLLETAYAALVWWEGDTLCAPHLDLPVLPSVTRRLVEDHAAQLGIEVRHVHATLADLDGRETWLLNAYQGLRLVTDWVGADLIPGPPHRFQAWRKALDET
ncbi:aminotransferase class IV [Corynebacterium yudongzhengii]|uniref:Aminotransferase class IV n=1 Tax=Corynebacterium yudongzhengii TaxID=2080740 RepID=A0A2U1T8L2_9CORY|nr:aminotransferase class IV [Corynebacterium yudongzhengii]AWB81958.1 aminotransferase class IV [Corynebacterium yudongzhengii]PWC02351.1 aminotransferase class IV [Corynebacterium yudongzhengii]